MTLSDKADLLLQKLYSISAKFFKKIPRVVRFEKMITKKDEEFKREKENLPPTENNIRMQQMHSAWGKRKNTSLNVKNKQKRRKVIPR